MKYVVVTRLYIFNEGGFHKKSQSFKTIFIIFKSLNKLYTDIQGVSHLSYSKFTWWVILHSSFSPLYF